MGFYTGAIDKPMLAGQSQCPVL